MSGFLCPDIELLANPMSAVGVWTPGTGLYGRLGGARDLDGFAGAGRAPLDRDSSLSVLELANLCLGSADLCGDRSDLRFSLWRFRGHTGDPVRQIHLIAGNLTLERRGGP